MIGKKIALGMSGGVDSSVAAHLLVEQGYDVTGVYLECWRAPGCRTEEDRKDALKVALELGITFQVLDFKQAYKDKVVEYFFQTYQAGQTPNPDVLCNKEIKFGLFYDWAMAQGFDFVATGHYASINKSTDLGAELLTLQIPKDTHKDQTYFLYRLMQHQLEHIIFPLQNLTKPEVRTLAKRKKLAVAEKKDSVGICFIGDINVGNFLQDRLGENPGEVVDTKGIVIGKHRGLWFYTVGQRHGFEIDKRTLVTHSDGSQFTKDNIPPFYVIDKDPQTNRLIVGFGSETLTQQFSITNPHFIYSQLESTQLTQTKLLVRIRHTGALMPCRLENQTIYLDTPTQGVAVGQSAVLYLAKDNTHICLGGGDIDHFQRYS